MKAISSLMAGVALLLIAAAPNGREQSEQLFASEAACTVDDEDFHTWIAAQQEIFARLEVCIQQAGGTETIEGHSLHADREWLLLALEKEVAHHRSNQGALEKRQWNVKAFGARGDGVTNDAPAIRRAIDAAVAEKAEKEVAEVFLPAGRYRVVHEEGDDYVIFHLNQIKNLRIRGEAGTELITDGALNVAFLLNECDSVWLETLKITSGQRAFAVGTIIDVQDPDQLIVAIEPGMPDPEEPYFTAIGFQGLCRFFSADADAETGRPSLSSVAPHAAAPKVEKITAEHNQYRFSLREALPVSNYYQAGLKMVYYARGYGNHMIVNQNSDRTRLKNIELTGSGGMAFLNDGGNACFIVDCRVQPALGTWISTAADAVYMRDVMLGGLVARNDFEGVGDDFFNNHNTARPAFRQERHVLYFPTWFHGRILAGAKRLGWIPITRGSTAVAREFTIESLEIVPGFPQTAFPELIKITVKEELPEVVTLEEADAAGIGCADLFTVLENQCHGLVMIGNRFANGVSRFLVGGRNWIFAENEIVDSLNHPYLVNIGQEFVPGRMGGESFQPRNLIWRNNCFRSNGKTVIQVNGGNPLTDGQRISYLQFSDNVFVERVACAEVPILHVAGAHRVEVNGNQFVTEASEEKRVPVIFVETTHATVDFNRFDDKVKEYSPMNIFRRSNFKKE